MMGMIHWDLPSVKGQLQFRDLTALGFGLKGEKETASAVFDLVFAEQKDKSFANLTLTDLQYENETGGF